MRGFGQEYSLHGADAAVNLLGVLKKGKDYQIGFLEMNELGYDLLARNDTKTAIEIFKVNTEQYPTSATRILKEFQKRDDNIRIFRRLNANEHENI